MSSTVASLADDFLILGKGEYRILDAPDKTAIYNSSGKTVQIRDQGSSLRLLGKSHGATTISLGRKNLRVVVTSEAQKKFAHAIMDYFNSRPGLNFLPQHPCHHVGGELLRWQDWQALRSMATSLRGCYIFQAEVAPEITHLVLTNLKNEIRTFGGPEPSVDLSTGAVITYPIEMEKSKAQLSSQLSPWGLNPSFASEVISIRPLIRIQITVAEVSRKLTRQLGINWPGSYGAKLIPQPKLADDWQLSLAALEQRGLGRVLANPSLLTRSGERAEFLAGGEIPLRIANHKSRQISWKKYGVNLNVLPKTDHRGYLDVDLLVEVSSPDPGLSADGLPAFKSHSIKTHFNLPKKSTIALGGLIRNETGRTSQGWPGLSKLPILGYLFSSKEFQENRSEMVIFVTPEVVNPGNQDSRLPEDWSKSEL